MILNAADRSLSWHQHRAVKGMKIAPSISRTFYEMIINTGPDDYRVTLSPFMFDELLKSANDAVKGKIPTVEERAATQLSMNLGNMLLVRLNQDGLQLFKPEDLYRSSSKLGRVVSFIDTAWDCSADNQIGGDQRNSCKKGNISSLC